MECITMAVLRELRDSGYKLGMSVNAGPILALFNYLQKLQYAEGIDSIVPLPGKNNKRFSHGKTAEVLLLFFYCAHHAIYRCDAWVQQNPILEILYPGIKHEYFTEGRIQDTFDAIFRAGLNNVIFNQCCNVARKWEISAKTINIDLTNFTLYGVYNEDGEQEGVSIEFGKPKSGKVGKKQFALETAVTEDNIPLHFRTLDGATADVTRYTEVWTQLKETLGTSDFVTTGDCKLTSIDNLCIISKGKGKYVGPEFTRTEYKLKEHLTKGTLSELYSSKNRNSKKSGKPTHTIFSGFDFQSDITDPKTNDKYYQRTLVIHSNTKAFDEIESLQRDVQRLLDNANLLREKSLKYGSNITKRKTKTKKDTFKSAESALAAATSVKNYDIVKDIVEIPIISHSEIITKYLNPGKPYEGAPTSEETVVWFEIGEAIIHTDALDAKKALCGYTILVTNIKPKDASIADILKKYKTEYRVEHTFRRLKNSVNLSPVYLHLPKRIEVLMYFLMTIVQVMAVMDRTVRIAIVKRKAPLVGLIPNKNSYRPKSEYMLFALRAVSILFASKDSDIEAEFYMPDDGNLASSIFSLLDDAAHIYTDEQLNDFIQEVIYNRPTAFSNLLH